MNIVGIGRNNRRGTGQPKDFPAPSQTKETLWRLNIIDCSFVGWFWLGTERGQQRLSGSPTAGRAVYRLSMAVVVS